MSDLNLRFICLQALRGGGTDKILILHFQKKKKERKEKTHPLLTLDNMTNSNPPVTPWQQQNKPPDTK